MGISTAETRPAATAAARDVTAWQITTAVAGLLAGTGVAWVVSHHGTNSFGVPKFPFAVPIIVLVGWSFIASGLVYWRSRPENHLWAVLVFQGFAWFGSMLNNSPNSVLFTIGQLVYPWQYASGLYLILSFPSGRLRGRLARAMMAIAIFLVTAGNLFWLLFADSHHSMCRTCPANLLEVTRDDAVVVGVFYVFRISGIVIALTSIGLLAVRWRRAGAAHRVV